MMTNDCLRAEVTAGALALDEATDAQRDDYRRHIAQCHSCLTNLGGERDIEQTMSLVARARDDERWQPDPHIVLRRQTRGARAWQIGLGALAAALVAWIGVHAFAPRESSAPERVASVARIPAAPHVQRHDARGHDLVVLHNVATLKRPPLPAQAPHALAAAPVPVRAAVAPRANHAAVVHAPSAVAVRSPSQRDERSVLALRTVGSAPPQPQRAESIAVLPPPGVTHDVIPLGGENAIVPHPSAIAYYENAEGTTEFEVSVDERGMPTKCSVTKSSGFLVLDAAVCTAALHARYSPRTINGRAVPGVFRDALTFQQSDDR